MENYNGLIDLITKAKEIVLTTHIYPDADGIGCQIALYHALKKMGKNVFCVNEQPLTSRYHYLTEENIFKSFEEFQKDHGIDVDLIIIVDANQFERLGEQMSQFAQSDKNFFFIDHHPCSEILKSHHIIDTKSAATGELVAKIIEKMGIEFTKEMALALYTAIIIDSSSFRYPSVSSETHRVVSILLKTGISVTSSYNQINGTKKKKNLKFLGRILSKTETSEDDKIAWLIINEKDLKEFDVQTDESLAYINHLLVLEGLEVAIMFREIDKNTKVSFRSLGKIDVSKLSRKFGGGGHFHSSASMIYRSLDDTINLVIEKTKEYLKEIDNQKD